jgi:type II secretory pathway component GspD/PulD (secretin)
MNSRRSNAAPARSHPRVSGDLEICRRFDIPACAGMTGSDLSMSSLLWSLVLLVLLTMAPAAHAGKISLSIQELDIREVMQMLSREQRLNIFVADGVSGDVSVNLYDMETDQVVKLIAESAGFVVEQRDNSYFVIERDDAGKLRRSDRLEVRSFKVQYAATSEIETIFQEYVSEFGSIKALQDNNLLVVEDLPSFLDRMEALLEEIDREPKQIMIEAKILEISLTDNQSYGLDWAKLFSSTDGSGALGVQGLANAASAGLFAQYTNSDVDLVLNALKERGRLRTISTPKLLAMEGLEAETVVGTEIGYRVTTTINQVSTESIEFLESGIILKVTPSVDRSGRIMLDIFPEVSTGVVSDDGIPSKATTQVSTRMLVPDGKTVFLGGLIQHQVNNTREGVPGLGDLPVIGGLFSNRAKSITSTEIVVLITPRIVNYAEPQFHEADEMRRVDVIKKIIDEELGATEEKMEQIFDGKNNYQRVETDRR